MGHSCPERPPGSSFVPCLFLAKEHLGFLAQYGPRGWALWLAGQREEES